MRVPYRPIEKPTPNLSSNDGDKDICDEMGGGDSKDLYGVHADVLIPGRGDPIQDGGMIISATEGTIVWVGVYPASLPGKYNHVSFQPKHAGALMPGLWDVHTHFCGADTVFTLTEAMQAFLPGSSEMIGAVLVDDLRCTLMAGFTSVRELGGSAGYLQPLIDKEFIVGPTVYSAMSGISITGGHGDQHNCPLSLVRMRSELGSNMFALCDGVDECIRMTRQVIRKGAKVIKIFSTGGVLSLNDQPEDSQFSPAELEAIVQEAGRSSRMVASHAIGKNGIMAALRAGVKSIEHGMYLDQEVADLMKEKGAILVGTRHAVESLNDGDAQDLPPILARKLERLVQLSRDSYKFAFEQGVQIALGTDTWSSNRKNPLAHGKNAREIHWMKEAGMSALQAIESTTAIPPETLGAMGPKAGQLREGFDADFIVVSKNPLLDVDVLTDPDNITHVWKRGKLFKSP